jgi:hypothetical protein
MARRIAVLDDPAEARRPLTVRSELRSFFQPWDTNVDNPFQVEAGHALAELDDLPVEADVLSWVAGRPFPIMDRARAENGFGPWGIELAERLS